MVSAQHDGELAGGREKPCSRRPGHVDQSVVLGIQVVDPGQDLFRRRRRRRRIRRALVIRCRRRHFGEESGGPRAEFNGCGWSRKRGLHHVREYSRSGPKSCAIGEKSISSLHTTTHALFHPPPFLSFSPPPLPPPTPLFLLFSFSSPPLLPSSHPHPVSSALTSKFIIKTKLGINSLILAFISHNHNVWKSHTQIRTRKMFQRSPHTPPTPTPTPAPTPTHTHHTPHPTPNQLLLHLRTPASPPWPLHTNTHLHQRRNNNPPPPSKYDVGLFFFWGLPLIHPHCFPFFSAPPPHHIFAHQTNP